MVYKLSKVETDLKFDYGSSQDECASLPETADFDPNTDELHIISGFQMCVSRLRGETRSHSLYFCSQTKRNKWELQSFPQVQHNLERAYQALDEIPCSNKFITLNVFEQEDVHKDRLYEQHKSWQNYTQYHGRGFVRQ